MKTTRSLPQAARSDFTYFGNEAFPYWSALNNLLVKNELEPSPPPEIHLGIDEERWAYSYTTLYPESGTSLVHDVRLVKNGVIVGSNLLGSPVNVTSGNHFTINVPVTETASSVQDVSFGFALSFRYPNRSNAHSEHIVLTGFKFPMPSDASVTAIDLHLTLRHAIQLFPPSYPTMLLLYNVEASAVYDFATGGLKLSGYGSILSYLRFDGYNHSTKKLERTYQYMVYSKGKFLGEINDVDKDPSVRSALNSFPGEVTVDVDRNAESDYYDTEPLEIVDDGEPEPLITERLETIDTTGDATKSFGEGTVIDTDNNVDIYEYYGNYEGFVLDDGEPLLFDDLEEMETPIGSPEGRIYFSGYISKYDLTYGKSAKKTSRLTLLSHTDDYNNIVLEKTDEDFLAISGADNEYKGLGRQPAAAPSTDNIALAQTLLFSSAQKLSIVYLKVKRFGAGDMSPSSYPVLNMFIYKGNPADGGQLVVSASASISKPTPYWQSFSLPTDITLNASQRYSIVFRAAEQFQVSSSYANYPIQLYSASSYGDGAAYYQTSQRKEVTEQWFTSSGLDIQLRLATRGGDTLVTMFSEDPSQMFKNIVDFGASKGSMVKYLENSITPSNTIVSSKFNMQTLKESLDAIISYTPTDWYWYIDQSDLTLYLNERSEEVSHTFTLGKDIEELKLEKSMEDLVNEVYFTGGQATAVVKLPFENKNWQGGSASGTLVSSQIFLPEPSIDYKVMADYPSKSCVVNVYKYYNNATTPTSNQDFLESGKQIFRYEPALEPTLTGICVVARTTDTVAVTPSSMVMSMVSDSNVYRHLVNQESQTKYRRALVKKTDQRVTNSVSADIIANSEMERNQAPIHAATLTVIRNEHLEHVSPGQLVGFRAFGNFIDDLQLVVMEVELTRDIMTLSLGAFAPKTSKRLEDLKRNLQILEQMNNPNAPTGGV